jgi:hypothetical protein
MKKELPNKKVNRWLILTVVALFSVAATFAVSKVISNSNMPDSGDESTESSVVDYEKTTDIPEVVVSEEYNYEEGYIDIFLASNTPLTLGELMFTVSEGTSYDSILEKGVFADYLENAKSENTVLIGATGGPDADIVMPTEKALFARLAFTNLTEGSVRVVEEDVVFFDEGNEFVTVTFE